MDKIIKTGIGVLLLKDNKVLLGHRVPKQIDTGGIYEPDSWTCPGGKQEYEETVIETAIRETKEEIGVNIDPSRLVFMAHIPYPDYLMHHYAFVYDWPEHTLDTSMFHFDDKEVEQVKWVPLSNFEQFIDKYGKNVVKKSTELRRIVHQTALDHFKEVE